MAEIYGADLEMDLGDAAMVVHVVGDVKSVNGKTGEVELNAADVHAGVSTVSYDPVTTVLTLANARAETINAYKLNEDYITPQMFGAKGDGTTDDTAAIQSAIDYALNNNIRDVYFPAGTYKVTAPLQVTVASTSGRTPASDRNMYWFGRGCRLRGESCGTTIIAKYGNGTMTIPSGDSYRGGETLDTVVYFGGTNGCGMWISDLTIDNGSTATDAWAVYATRARVGIDRSNLSSNSHGIFCYGWTNTLQDVVVSCASQAITMANCTSTVLNKVYCNGADPYNINASYTTLIGCCGDGVTGTVFNLSGNVAMIGCGSESPNCDRYVDVSGVGTVVMIENFYAWAFIATGKSYFRAGTGSVLSIDGVRIMRNASSGLASGTSMLSTNGAARIALKNAAMYDNGGGSAFPDLQNGLDASTQLNLEYGSYHGRYSVDSDGNLVPAQVGVDAFFDIVGGHYAEVPDFTNLYTGKEDGYIYSGSPPTKTAQANYSILNLVPAVPYDVIRTSGINLLTGDNTIVRMVFFDSQQQPLAYTSMKNLTGQSGAVSDWGGRLDADGNLTYTFDPTCHAASLVNTAYIALCVRTTGIGANPAISVNEEIKTKIEYVSGSVTLKDGIMVQQTPTENNEPASKKYVDDAIAALRAELA